MKLINCHNYSCRSYQYSILNAPHVIFALVILPAHSIRPDSDLLRPQIAFKRMHVYQFYLLPISCSCLAETGVFHSRAHQVINLRSGSQAAIRETARTRAFYGFARAKGLIVAAHFHMATITTAIKLAVLSRLVLLIFQVRQ